MKTYSKGNDHHYNHHYVIQHAKALQSSNQHQTMLHSYNFVDRSFSENTYENCHIYENSKPRSKSVETYLSSAGGDNGDGDPRTTRRNPIKAAPGGALPTASAALTKEHRMGSSDNLLCNKNVGFKKGII